MNIIVQVENKEAVSKLTVTAASLDFSPYYCQASWNELTVHATSRPVQIQQISKFN